MSTTVVDPKEIRRQTIDMLRQKCLSTANGNSSLSESVERTDYTYGDSGSYRSDQLPDDTFKTPNMARFPIHSYAVQYHHPMSSSKKVRTSTRRSSRTRDDALAFYECQEVRGQMCSHVGCEPDYVSINQNNNNVSLTPRPNRSNWQIGESNELVTTSSSTGRRRGSNVRRSTRSNKLTDAFSASTSSTYVYEPEKSTVSASQPPSIWSLMTRLKDATVAQPKVQDSAPKWVNKHIFGLDKSSASNPDLDYRSNPRHRVVNSEQQFLSSDMDGEDKADVHRARLRSRRKTSSVATGSRQRLLSKWLSQAAYLPGLLVNMLYSLTSVLVYACYRLAKQVATTIGSFFFNSSDRHDITASQTSTSDRPQAYERDSSSATSWAWWLCRLLLWALLLIPLLMLLAFVLSPVTDNSTWALHWDSDCSRLQNRPIPTWVNTTYQVARFRLACLYASYLAKESGVNTGEPFILSSWLAWLRSASWNKPSKVDLDTASKDYVELQAKWAAFSIQVTSKIDQLADQLKHYDGRLERVSLSSNQATAALGLIQGQIGDMKRSAAESPAPPPPLDMDLILATVNASLLHKQLLDLRADLTGRLSEDSTRLGNQLTSSLDQLIIQVKSIDDQLKDSTTLEKREELLAELLTKTSPNSPLFRLIQTIVEDLARTTAEGVVQDNLASLDLSSRSSVDGSSTPCSASGIPCVSALIQAALDKYAADRTGRTDFALESGGGSIVGTRCTRTYTEGSSVLSVFGIPLARVSKSARTILDPSNNQGDCWPFHGDHGQVVIKLSAPIYIDAVTLEHLPLALAPNKRLDSAPNQFLIKGLKSDDDEEGLILGNYTYNLEGHPIQTFPVEVTGDKYQFIELDILSNHGHPVYTCVYRLRVHGFLEQLAEQQPVP